MNENVDHTKVDAAFIKSIYKKRDPFTHKGDYGHACLITGSVGLMGAAVLATKACLRAGAGKVTVYSPKIGCEILQISAPEAMTKIAGENYILSVDDLNKYDSMAIGPGIGLYESHKDLLKNIFLNFDKPMVIDADALNTLSNYQELLEFNLENSIITPHAVEFERLFGKTANEVDRNNLAMQMSHRYKIFIVLKGHNTLVTTPDGKCFLNTTGNAGMATRGSGDVLTGILTGLLAQKYLVEEACLLGVFIHGLAGNIAAKNLSEEAMIAGDIINYLGEAFKKVSRCA